MDSKDRKGVAARLRSWAQSHWLQPDGSASQEYLVITVATVVYAAVFAMARANIVLIIETLVLGLVIASLVKNAVWKVRKLNIVRGVLLDIAFHVCRCNPNADAMIIVDPMEPETVGKPTKMGKGYCSACRARAVLEEEFPGAIAYRIREHVLGGWPMPEDLDLACYLTPADWVLLRDELGAGWKVPFHPQ